MFQSFPVLGQSDPLCSLPNLYEFLKTTKGNISVNVFGGGHALTLGAPGRTNEQPLDHLNIEVAVGAAVQWARLMTL